MLTLVYLISELLHLALRGSNPRKIFFEKNNKPKIYYGLRSARWIDVNFRIQKFYFLIFRTRAKFVLMGTKWWAKNCYTMWDP